MIGRTFAANWSVFALRASPVVSRRRRVRFPRRPIETAVLPPGIRSRFVDDINGLRVHVLEAGFDPPGRPLVLMLHGFPEIAYSWRKIMPPLAAAGFYVVAPDLRGYGRTIGWSADYDAVFWINEHFDAAGDPWLPSDEPRAFERQHHLVNRRRADAKKFLHVGFGRGWRCRRV